MQKLVLFLQLFDETHLRVIILNGLIRYVARLARILQSTNVLFDIHVTWVQAGDHQAVGVATEGMPEERSKFRFPIGDVGVGTRGLLVRKGGYNLSQCEETLIDVDAFLVRLIPSEGLSLTTGQVHHLKLARDDIVWIGSINLFNRQREHRVRSTRLVIHCMRCHYFVLDTKVVERHDIFGRTALKGVQILHGEVVVLIPSQF